MGLITRLPLDLEGTAISNRINGEEHTLIRVNNRKDRILTPRLGAFYEDNFILYNSSGQMLDKKRDYKLTYLYDDLTVLTGYAIYGMVVITNPEVSTQVKIDYRAVGGPNVLNVKELKAAMDKIADGSLEFKYSDIVGKPDAFIPDEHEQYWWEIYGMESTLASLKNIEESITNRDDYIEGAVVQYGDRLLAECTVLVDNFAEAARRHYVDYFNPHKSNKQKIGLGFMNNWPIATDTESVTGDRVDLYLSPSGAYQILAAGFVPAINAHAQDQEDPHNITAEQLNAYTREVKLQRLGQLLDRGLTAVNSVLFNDSSWLDFFNAARTDIPVGNVVSGFFEPVRVGGGPVGAGVLMTNSGSFRAVSDIFKQYAKASNSAIYVGAYTDAGGALNALNASFMDSTAFPIGTIAFARVRASDPFGTSWNAIYFTRTSSGWIHTTA